VGAKGGVVKKMKIVLSIKSIYTYVSFE